MKNKSYSVDTHTGLVIDFDSYLYDTKFVLPRGNALLKAVLYGEKLIDCVIPVQSVNHSISHVLVQ